jgi:uncharacterized protein (DUF983 family)
MPSSTEPLMTPDLRAFLRTVKGRCPDCLADVVFQGHTQDCQQVKR